MKIALDNLEEKFLATALKNGLSYWKKDQFEIIEDNGGTIKARVYGTDEYVSELYFNGNSVVDVNCSCPNNRTLFCKHIAILYFEKFKDILELKKSKPRATRTKKLSQSATPPKIISLEERISVMTKDVLLDLVRFGIKNDANFKRLLEDKLHPKNQSAEEIYRFYKAEIKQLIKSHKKDWYISASASNKIGKHIIAHAAKAEGFMEQQQFDKSFAVCKSIIDCVIPALYDTDTSSGLFYQGLETVIEIANDISFQKNLDEELRADLFKYFLKTFKNENNHGFGYEEDFLNIIIQLSTTKERKVLEKAISKFGIDYFTLQTYALTKKFDGEKAAQQLLEKHKLVPEFRTLLFNQFMDAQDYEAAKECMYEGIEVNKEYPGIVIDYVKNLLEVAERTNDRDLKIRMCKTLFVNLGFRVNPENIQYYDVLKEELSDIEWEEGLPELIEHINDKQTLEEIYYRESFLEALYESVIAEPNFYFERNTLTCTPKYVEVLVLPYHNELQQFLQNRIEGYLNVFQGKSYYKEVCTALITFKKAGMNINPIIDYLKQKFNRRPSLQARLKESFG